MIQSTRSQAAPSTILVFSGTQSFNVARTLRVIGILLEQVQEGKEQR